VESRTGQIEGYRAEDRGRAIIGEFYVDSTQVAIAQIIEEAEPASHDGFGSELVGGTEAWSEIGRLGVPEGSARPSRKFRARRHD